MVVPSKVSGFYLFYRQTISLIVKNATLAYRGLTATLLQVASSFFFIFLIWCIDKAITARYSNVSTFKNLPDPDVKSIPAIPKCEDGYYIKTPCYDFIWSGNGNPTIVSLVKNITQNNPGRPIEFEKKVCWYKLIESPTTSQWLKSVSPDTWILHPWGGGPVVAVQPLQNNWGTSLHSLRREYN